MKNDELISIGLCMKVLVGTIGQDCLLEYSSATTESKDYSKQRQKLSRLKNREQFDKTTIKNLKEFSELCKDWGEWMIKEDLSNGMVMNYVDRFLTIFTQSSVNKISTDNILYVTAYSICYVFWETLLSLFSQDENQNQTELIKCTLSAFDLLDKNSKYLETGKIFKNIFNYLDQFISDRVAFLNELEQWIYTNGDGNEGHETRRQIERWKSGEQSPSWKYVKLICSPKFIPSENLFRKIEGIKDEDFNPKLIWMTFRRLFLLGYFTNNFFESLIKNDLISIIQKDYLIDGIRHMYRYTFYNNALCKADYAAEQNFMFYSLYYTFNKNLPEGGLNEYIDEFIPWLMNNNPAINFGIHKILGEQI